MTNEQGHILVVDDHKTNRIKLSFAVKKLGHTVETAENGQQALNMLRAQGFDLVLLDIIMPEMDGYQMLEQMKNDSALRDIPVIVISAQQEMENVVRGIELGANDYLPKTFDPIFLKARVGACLEKKQFRDQEKAYFQQIDRLTEAAVALEADRFDPESLSDVAERDDALGHLTRLFQRMAREFYAREQRLKQQMAELCIEVNEVKQSHQVAEITGTDYFKHLKSRAQDLRNIIKGEAEE